MKEIQPRICADLTLWTTVVLGLEKTPEQYRQAIRSKGMSLSDWGSAILEQVSCSQMRTSLTLVKIPVDFLGFQAVGSCGRIYEKGRELNLELCPAEVGPALRLQYPSTYHPKWTLIAMEPIADIGGQESIFRLAGPSCCHGPELTCGLGNQDASYAAESYFIFVLGR